MKKLLGLVAVTLTALVSVSTANAASTGNVSVTSVSVGGSGDVFVKTNGTFVPSAGCTNGSTYLLPNTHNARSSLLAILLTAQASGLEVKMSTAVACAQVGSITYTQLVNIAILGS